MFQFHCLFEHMSALQNICLAPRHVYRVPPEAAERAGRDLLRQLGVEARADALPRELSGGEAQRVAIARALAVNPPVLLMDEPMASLDASRRAELGALLQKLTESGRTLLVTTHDERFAEDFATRVLTIESGSAEIASLARCEEIDEAVRFGVRHSALPAAMKKPGNNASRMNEPSADTRSKRNRADIRIRIRSRDL